MKEIVVYDWPLSKTCMECLNGESITSDETFQNLDYICHVRCKFNDGLNCPDFEAPLPDEDDEKIYFEDVSFMNH